MIISVLNYPLPVSFSVQKHSDLPTTYLTLDFIFHFPGGVRYESYLLIFSTYDVSHRLLNLTRISFHYEYASADIMMRIFQRVKRC